MKLYFQYGALIAVLSQIYFAPHENFVAPLSLGLVFIEHLHSFWVALVFAAAILLQKMRVPAKFFNKRHGSTVVKRDTCLNNLINKQHNSLKLLVLGGKSRLFANPLRGVRASAAIYNQIETAKENTSDPYRYLLRVLRNAPTLSETK